MRLDRVRAAWCVVGGSITEIIVSPYPRATFRATKMSEGNMLGRGMVIKNSGSQYECRRMRVSAGNFRLMH